MGMSRNEDILQAIIDNGDSSQFSPPRSREEGLLLQILDKISRGGSGLSFHICSSDEYDHYTMVPTISDPSSTTFYLVPTSNVGNDIYNEWVYVNGYWEKFGSGGVLASIPSSAVIDNSGLISWKNDSGTVLFTLQLPLYNGGVS